MEMRAASNCTTAEKVAAQLSQAPLAGVWKPCRMTDFGGDRRSRQTLEAGNSDPQHTLIASGRLVDVGTGARFARSGGASAQLGPTQLPDPEEVQL